MLDNLTRGLYTDVVDIRRRVFAEVARVILNHDHNDLYNIKIEITKIPYNIIHKDDPTYRCCVYKERAIVTERVRLALGLPLWKGALNGPLYTGIEEVLKSEKIKTPEIVKVIPEACEKCPTKAYKATDNCRKCLAHPCSVVCPADAISFTEKSALINQDKCIKCGRCQMACPYNAIVNYNRPCAAACGVNAIENDESGRAIINQEECVKCGMCIVACPFGAIADKSEFIQVLIAFKEKKSMYAIIAPSFAGQFGPLVSPSQILAGIKQIGYNDVVEVAYGADVATIKESKEWFNKIENEHQKYLGTSCCPAWVDMAKKHFPEESENISDSYTPMVATAKYIKNINPDAVITFIGPCIAKKSESLRPEVREYVDFVITFEELAAILVAKDIDLAEIHADGVIDDASGSGRNYAVSGGVAEALKTYINEYYPDSTVIIDKRDSLKECIKMLKDSKQGKSDANILEGMACPNGCVGGAGIIAPLKRTMKEITLFAKSSQYYPACKNPKIKLDGE